MNLMICNHLQPEKVVVGHEILFIENLATLQASCMTNVMLQDGVSILFFITHIPCHLSTPPITNSHANMLKVRQYVKITNQVSTIPSYTTEK